MSATVQYRPYSKDRASQRGMTLMSLLVSINLSMLAMLAALNMYTNHRLSATEATQGAEYTSQLTHARLIIENELTNAGYGIAVSATPNVGIYSVGTGADRNHLRWKYFDNGSTVCRGIHDNGVAIDGINYRQLTLVQSSVNCNTDGNFELMVWQPVAIIGRWPLTDELSAYVNSNNSLFQFALNGAGDCSPFGAMPVQQRQSVTITAPSFTELNMLAENSSYSPPSSSSFTVCLPN